MSCSKRPHFSAGGAWSALAAALLIAVPLAPAQADENKIADVSFQHKDWALQCDNTRTCRAVGYQAEAGDSEPVSILLTRAAGPGTPVQVDLQVYTEKTELEALELRVGKLLLRDLEGHEVSRVAAHQVPRFLRELLKNDEATVTSGKDQWTLSLAGVSAVLLKMDEAQGRVGTPGALVRRGTQAESSVPAAVPVPVFHATRPLPERKGDGALAKPLLAAIDVKEVAERCNGDAPKPADVQVHRLTERMVLLSIPCAMGAYNFGALNWLANDRAPYQPQQLDAEGDFDAVDGSIRSAMKGRGIGDCWSTQQWHFDGRSFVVTGESGDSMCRGFPGGAWQLPTYTAKVVLPTHPVSKKP